MSAQDTSGNIATPDVQDSQLAIILAGGAATRIGELGCILPKSMLAVSSSETLLTRILGQLSDASVNRIVVSTSPQQAPLLDCFVGRYVTESKTNKTRSSTTISVFSNEGHFAGPIPALANAIEHHPCNDYFLCLSDIFFKENPFIRLVHLDNLNDEAVLLVGQHDLNRGGVVLIESNKVSQLSYRPRCMVDSNMGKSFNWTGAAYFGAEVSDKIRMFGRTATQRPLEEIFNFLISRGYSIAVRDAGEFVNVNTFADLIDCQSMAEDMYGQRVRKVLSL